jgi:hypothetical protein
MDRIGQPHRLVDPTAGDCLLKVPILRGWGGEIPAQDWMTVGSGRKLEAVRARKDELRRDDIEDEWTEWSRHLSNEFVQYAQHTKFILFRCLGCPLFI